jgi:cytoskeletal protein CcmA (bactofilin family)
MRCAEVTLGLEAAVRTQIHAGRANIRENVDGEIRSQRVILSSTARVFGDIVHKELAIEAGAYVGGG